MKKIYLNVKNANYLDKWVYSGNNEVLNAENCLRILFRIVLESYVLKVGVC